MVISVDGELRAIDKDSGDVLWTSTLDSPMIGSREENQHELKKDFFIPLIDGSLIRFDQDEDTGIAFLEKTKYNMRDQSFIDAINSKNQCIVTGNAKTTAI
jgi:PQQ enzyme repeat